MGNIVDLTGKTVGGSTPKPRTDTETGTFLFQLNVLGADNQYISFKAEGFLVVTSVFAAVGRGEGEIVAMVPMGQLMSVQKIEAIA